MERAFHIIVLALLFIASTLVAGCGMPCDLENYGYAKLTNNSSTNSDYYFYIDNEYIGILAAGKSTSDEDVSLGKGNHEIIFKLSTGTIACGWNATIEECTTSQFSCDI